jgi:hypothetical protein
MTLDDYASRRCCQSYPGDPHAGDCDGSPMTSEADAYAAAERAARRADEFGLDW